MWLIFVFFAWLVYLLYWYSSRNNNSVQDENDNEEVYRKHLALLISKTNSRGNGRYFNKFLNKCRDEAALKYPKGAAAAKKKDNSLGFF